jgi:hypothetical protein
MPKFLRSRKLVIATAVAGVGVLGVGVAGAVGGISVTPGPSDHAGSHPAPEATSATLPAAASAGSANASAATSQPEVTEGTPSVGDAPSESNLSTALDQTAGTPGNTVLNDLINTAPGADRGATIASDAQSFASTQAPTPPVPDTAPVPDEATSHIP